MTVIRIPIEITRAGSGLKATLAARELEKQALEMRATSSAELGEQTPGQRLLAYHRRFVERIRKRERKEHGDEG